MIHLTPPTVQRHQIPLSEWHGVDDSQTIGNVSNDTSSSYHTNHFYCPITSCNRKCSVHQVRSTLLNPKPINNFTFSKIACDRGLKIANHRHETNLGSHVQSSSRTYPVTVELWRQWPQKLNGWHALYPISRTTYSSSQNQVTWACVTYSYTSLERPVESYPSNINSIIGISSTIRNNPENRLP